MKLFVAGLLAAFLPLQPAPPAALRIVVLEGEDAVNIVQQKTAVRPLVEVRDRNNLPVAGATVTFTIGGGQPAAFAGGLQTLTVTTNAAGQAAASGLNAISSGAFQIQVQAAYQGQLATAAISQTNFATAAAAAQAGSAASGAGGTGGGTSGAAGGAAGGGGGGISGTTIGIVGAAVGGGALAATQLGGGDGEGDASRPTSGTTFTGSFTGQIIVTTVTGSSTCMSTRALNGTLRITLRDGNQTGRAEMEGARTEIAFTASPTCSALPGPVPLNLTADVSGGPSNLSFQFESTGTGPTPTGGSVTAVETTTFSGSLSGGTINGTVTFTHATRGSNATSSIAGNGTTTIAVTLR
jgi:hypothetical protein